MELSHELQIWSSPVCQQSGLARGCHFLRIRSIWPDSFIYKSGHAVDTANLSTLSRKVVRRSRLKVNETPCGNIWSLKEGYRKIFFSFIGPVGHNIWWENRWNGSFGPTNVSTIFPPYIMTNRTYERKQIFCDTLPLTAVKLWVCCRWKVGCHLKCKKKMRPGKTISCIISDTQV